jgi:DNA-directed RNA polymerase specialized sigma24 family protein
MKDGNFNKTLITIMKRRSKLNLCISRLPIKRIEKSFFMYLEDKDYREIAETLGISEVNARVKMNRIKGN